MNSGRKKKLVVRKDSNGNVVGARGSVSELKLIKFWLESLRDSNQLGPGNRNVSMPEAISMWEKVKVIEA